MTADVFSDDAQRGFECGMDVHLAEPFASRECVGNLQNACHGFVRNTIVKSMAASAIYGFAQHNSILTFPRKSVIFLVYKKVEWNIEHADK